MNYNSLHIGNIANIAYATCKILDKYQHPVELICHDENHLMSQPEWNDLELDPEDFPNENNFFSNTSKIMDYKLPLWFKRSNVFSENHSTIRKIASYLPLSLKSFIKPIYSKIVNPVHLKKTIDFKYPYDDNHKLYLEEVYNEAKIWGIKKEDLNVYLPHAYWLNKQIQEKDLCFAYAASPIYCLLGSHKPYIATEIGTLRDIPPESGVTGKILALSYQRANFVIVTNPDAREQMNKLGIKKYRFCPHPVDEDVYKPLDRKELNYIKEELLEGHKSDLLIMAPARQNWKLKGNDKYLKAIKKLKDQGIIIRLVVPLWGQDIDNTKKLVKSLGIESQVKWIKPLSEPLLIKYLTVVDAVIDQLELGVFGFVTAKALACELPVLTSYDKDLHHWCFDEHPPILNCNSTEELTENLKNLIDAPYRKKIGVASRNWFLKYHSSSVVHKILNETAEEIIRK